MFRQRVCLDIQCCIHILKGGKCPSLPPPPPPLPFSLSFPPSLPLSLPSSLPPSLPPFLPLSLSTFSLPPSPSLSPSPPHRGSAIARIVGWNIQEKAGFVPEVKMWVFEEMVNGRKLTEIINETHCNEKYLPDFELPSNVVRMSYRRCVSIIIIIMHAPSCCLFDLACFFLPSFCTSH